VHFGALFLCLGIDNQDALHYISSVGERNHTMIKLYTKEEKKELVFKAVTDIAAGIPVRLLDASGSAHAVCIGDLREYGWAEKICTRSSMYWHYTGPNSVIVGDQVVKSGEYTEEIDMDWS